MSSIFTAYRACNPSSKTFTHLFKNQIRQFSKQTRSPASFRFLKKDFKKTFIFTGLFGSVCYGLKSLDSDVFLSYLRSMLPNIIANCKEDTSKGNRTRHYEKTIGEKAEEDSKSDENTDKFDWVEFFKLLFKEKYYFIAAVCSAFIVAILNIYIPQNLGNLINSIYELLKNGNQNTSFESLYKPSFELLKVYAAQSVFTFSYIYLLGAMGENIAKEMKVKLFSTIIRQDIAFYDKTRSGELINRLTNDVQEFKSSFKLCVSQGLRSITQIIGSCVSLYLISPKLTLVTAVLMPLLVGIGSIFGSVLRIYSKQAQQQVAKSTSVADESINNVRTVRAFAMENTEIEMFTEELEKARLLNIKLSFGIGIFQGFSNFFINGMVLSVIYAGGYMMLNNEINAGQLMAYLTATQMIQRSFAQFSILFGTALRGLSSGARVFDYMKLVPTIPTDDQGKKLENLQGSISFKNVTFSYPTRNQTKVLNNFNLDVKSGQVVAVVGNSGSGKSTVCALLERFYDLDSGKLTIDGVDIKEISPYWLRSQAIGYISQEPVLFHTSVAENIRYGRPEASNAEVEAAAKLANAHEFISKFPQKYDTVIGERGVTISGGQKQRIAISRALLKDPKILILDEATSALDAKSEKLVQETINQVVKNRTVIIVAHRLSTVKNADLIVVMQDGCIIETGKHEELMKLKGHYYNLFNIQMHSSNN